MSKLSLQELVRTIDSHISENTENKDSLTSLILLRNKLIMKFMDNHNPSHLEIKNTKILNSLNKIGWGLCYES
jgi:hypothetical protein